MQKKRSPWLWVPSLYFAEGIPYMIVNTVSVLIFKQLGMSNSMIAFFTSFLMFPWVIKPLWTPVVDLYGTKKRWVLFTQFAMGIMFALAVFALPLEFASQALLVIFMLLAFLSATHDAAADGFYILGLEPENQAFFTGIRSTFYRIAMVTAQGGVVLLAGVVQNLTGLEQLDFDLTSTTKTSVVEISGAVNRDIAVVISKTGVPMSAEERALYADAVTAYNASPDSAALAAITPPEGEALLEVYLKRPLEAGETRQLALTPEGRGDVVLLNSDRLLYKADTIGLPLLVRAKVDKGTPDAVLKVRVQSGNFILAWMVALGSVAALYLVLPFYHKFAMPKERGGENKVAGMGEFYTEFWGAFASFFMKKNVVIALLFILGYRFAESQLLKIGSLFLVDSPANGGLGLSNSEYGVIYGTIGVLSLLVGGVAGGFVLSRHGLRFWMFIMALALNLPDVVYLYMSTSMPESRAIISSMVAIEQLGYGFGFAGYTLFMIYFAEDSGKYATSHFAIMTGLMALGVMLPGMPAGKIQETLFNGSYPGFFTWVMVATLVSFIVTIPAMRIVPKTFGCKAG